MPCHALSLSLRHTQQTSRLLPSRTTHCKNCPSRRRLDGACEELSLVSLVLVEMPPVLIALEPRRRVVLKRFVYDANGIDGSPVLAPTHISPD